MGWTPQPGIKDDSRHRKQSHLRFVCLALALMLLGSGLRESSAQDPIRPARAVVVIHGGAGSITRDNMSVEREEAYREKIGEALRAGQEVVRNGGSSLDAVIAAITILEESPLFNAGRGAVLTSAGTVELDASIMDGRTRSAGAVASIQHVKSPIRLARAVMEQSPHVLLVGQGAESFAEEMEMEMVPNEYFRTDRRLDQYRQRDSDEKSGSLFLESDEHKYGTVGALALDRDGNLAAGTSTGGTAYKRWGRVGDSPIIGAGTYADNATCAVSATGTGEYFIRGVLAYRTSALMQYAGLTLAEAAASVIHGTLSEMGGDGGLIALDREGNVATPFNTSGMFRGYIDEAGNMHIAMFADE